jgi:hypothetical protein
VCSSRLQHAECKFLCAAHRWRARSLTLSSSLSPFPSCSISSSPPPPSPSLSYLFLAPASPTHTQVRYAHGSQCYSCIQKRLDSSVGGRGDVADTWKRWCEGGGTAAATQETEAEAAAEAAGRETGDSSAQCSVMSGEVKLVSNKMPAADEKWMVKMPSAESVTTSFPNEETGSGRLVGRAVVYVVNLPGDRPIRPVGKGEGAGH